LTKNHRIVWVHGEARLIPDESGRPVLLQGVAFDITEGKRAEEIVKSSLREKELLLKEIHHRVKNNLQITSSLLRLQAGKIADAGVRQLLRESQDRIRSMALVHDMLYRSQDLARVDFPDYVRTLVIQLFRSYNAGGRIRSSVELEPIVFGVDLAVPCGLIINELVANALKHAFPGERQGNVRVRMSSTPDRYILSVRDDGVGLPPQLDYLHTETLGLQLVRMLTEQIGGHVRLDTTSGTEFIIQFPRQTELR
jgi:two-component sensor histidine kinase